MDWKIGLKFNYYSSLKPRDKISETTDLIAEFDRPLSKTWSDRKFANSDQIEGSKNLLDQIEKNDPIWSSSEGADLWILRISYKDMVKKLKI